MWFEYDVNSLFQFSTFLTAEEHILPVPRILKLNSIHVAWDSVCFSRLYPQ